jgi:hypothetical protein
VESGGDEPLLRALSEPLVEGELRWAEERTSWPRVAALAVAVVVAISVVSERSSVSPVRCASPALSATERVMTYNRKYRQIAA